MGYSSCLNVNNMFFMLKSLYIILFSIVQSGCCKTDRRYLTNLRYFFLIYFLFEAACVVPIMHCSCSHSSPAKHGDFILFFKGSEADFCMEMKNVRGKAVKSRILIKVGNLARISAFLNIYLCRNVK